MLGELTIGYGSTRDAIDVFFAIPKELRSRHCYVLGRTGVGKSSLLEQMILQDLRQDYTTMVFDAGDLIPSLLQKMDDETQERVQLFTVERPLPYNPLLRRRDEPGRLENEVFSLLDQITVESSTTQPLTARMKRLLSVVLRAVMQNEEPTFSTLTTYLLEEKSKLRKQLELGRDEFQIAFEGVIDRLHQLLRDARVRRVICGPHTLNFDDIFDTGRILLVSLAGVELPLVRLLGTILFHGSSATILERREDRRRDVAIYIDEYQDYIASHQAVMNFQKLFTQSRRYGAGLVVAHQDFGTIDPRLLHTIHANVASIVAFSCGPDEAEKMSRIFGGDYQPHFISFLSDHHAITRIGEQVFELSTFAPENPLRPAFLEEEGRSQDPPDPFEVYLHHHATRDPYHQARKPKRAQTTAAPGADLPAPG